MSLTVTNVCISATINTICSTGTLGRHHWPLEELPMKLRTVDHARVGLLRRYCAIPLAALGIVLAGCACSGGSKPTCTGDLEQYKGRCLTHTAVAYVGCTEDRGFTVTNEISGGVNLPTVAESTFNAAYKRSREEDSTVALQIVKDRLQLAEKKTTSATDRTVAKQYEQQATRYADVIKRGIPAIEPVPSKMVDCGSVEVGAQASCQDVTIKSTGVAALHITRVEMTGADSADFRAGDECVDKQLAPDERCTMTVRFQPSAAGERHATMVIHQN